MRLTHFLAISLCGIVNVACQMDEIEVPREELYTRAFIKEFGIPDPDQDWNVATRVTANVDPDLVRGAETISVYDCMPGGPDCQLAARFSASATTFDFDFAKGNTRAYIQATDARGTVVASGYYPIEDGTLKVSNRTSRADETTACTIKATNITDYREVRESFSSDLLGAIDANGVNIWGMYEGGSSWMCWGQPEQPENGNPYPDFRKNGETSNNDRNNYVRPILTANNVDDGRTTSELAQIVGRNGVFHENTADNGRGQCNLAKYKDLLKPENGVTYAPIKDKTKISIEYIYGAGLYHNSMGYFYYKKGASDEEKLKSPMLMLMFDASPWCNTRRKYNNETAYSNFTWYGGKDSEGNSKNGYQDILNYAGMLPSNDIDGYENNNIEAKYKSSTYNLVYYPQKADGSYDMDNGTYEFPADVEIGFFLICQGYPKMIGKGTHGNVAKSDFRFSIPSLNKKFGNNFTTTGNHQDSYNNSDAAMSFVTYNWGGRVVMGVEDGNYDNQNAFSDHDMNDILFFVNGVEPPLTEDLGEDPKIQSWVIACEDLGSSYDFDFNDVVFGVSHFSSDKKELNYLKVKALAAGGTLPVQLYWQPRNRNNPIDVGALGGYSRWNDWFGVSNQNSVINAHGYTDNGGVVTINLFNYGYDLGDNKYTISEELFATGADGNTALGGFSLMVYDKNNPNGKRWVKPIGNYENKENGESWYNAPQMILVHKKWCWPVELQPIFDVYGENITGTTNGQKQTSFSLWIQDRFNTEWTLHPTKEELVVHHTWRGEAVDAN